MVLFEERQFIRSHTRVVFPGWTYSSTWFFNRWNRLTQLNSSQNGLFLPSGSELQVINTFIPKRAWLPRAESWVRSTPGIPKPVLLCLPFKHGAGFTFPRETFLLDWNGWSDGGGGAFRAPLKLIYYLERPQVGRRSSTWNASPGLGTGRLRPPVVVWKSAICGGKWITINFGFWYCGSARWY